MTMGTTMATAMTALERPPGGARAELNMPGSSDAAPAAVEFTPGVAVAFAADFEDAITAEAAVTIVVPA
jgi:hypothetical protein